MKTPKPSNRTTTSSFFEKLEEKAFKPNHTVIKHNTLHSKVNHKGRTTFQHLPALTTKNRKERYQTNRKQTKAGTITPSTFLGIVMV
jgi:hypothetical protein